MYEEFGFPPEVQRWILGRRLADNDHQTLAQHRVTTNGCPVFLYLVAPRLNPRQNPQIDSYIGRRNSDQVSKSKHPNIKLLTKQRSLDTPGVLAQTNRPMKYNKQANINNTNTIQVMNQLNVNDTMKADEFNRQQLETEIKTIKSTKQTHEHINTINKEVINKDFMTKNIFSSLHESVVHEETITTKPITTIKQQVKDIPPQIMGLVRTPTIASVPGPDSWKKLPETSTPHNQVTIISDKVEMNSNYEENNVKLKLLENEQIKNQTENHQITQSPARNSKSPGQHHKPMSTFSNALKLAAPLSASNKTGLGAKSPVFVRKLHDNPNAVEQIQSLSESKTRVNQPFVHVSSLEQRRLQVQVPSNESGGLPNLNSITSSNQTKQISLQATSSLIDDILHTKRYDTSSASIASIDGWVCPRCTLVNSLHRPGCEACSAERPENIILDDAEKNQTIKVM